MEGLVGLKTRRRDQVEKAKQFFFKTECCSAFLTRGEGVFQGQSRLKDRKVCGHWFHPLAVGLGHIS